MPKRKRKADFYAVAVGHKTGIFSTWDLCWEQVNGYSGGKQKGFLSGQEAEAQAYLNSYAVSFAPLPLESDKIQRPTM